MLDTMLALKLKKIQDKNEVVFMGLSGFNLGFDLGQTLVLLMESVVVVFFFLFLSCMRYLHIL